MQTSNHKTNNAETNRRGKRRWLRRLVRRMVGTRQIKLQISDGGNATTLDVCKQILDADAHNVVTECDLITHRILVEISDVFRMPLRLIPRGYANITVSMAARRRLLNRKEHLSRWLVRRGHRLGQAVAVQNCLQPETVAVNQRP